MVDRTVFVTISGVTVLPSGSVTDSPATSFPKSGPDGTPCVRASLASNCRRVMVIRSPSTVVSCVRVICWIDKAIKSPAISRRRDTSVKRIGRTFPLFTVVWNTPPMRSSSANNISSLPLHASLKKSSGRMLDAGFPAAIYPCGNSFTAGAISFAMERYSVHTSHGMVPILC